jgi:hypothetical protein
MESYKADPRNPLNGTKTIFVFVRAISLIGLLIGFSVTLP